MFFFFFTLNICALEYSNHFPSKAPNVPEAGMKFAVNIRHVKPSIFGAQEFFLLYSLTVSPLILLLTDHIGTDLVWDPKPPL